MAKLKNILDGWCNDFKDELGLLPIDKKRIAIDRLLICDMCDTRTNKICDKKKGGCGCPIKKKTKAFNDSCPLRKW